MYARRADVCMRSLSVNKFAVPTMSPCLRSNVWTFHQPAVSSTTPITKLTREYHCWLGSQSSGRGWWRSVGSVQWEPIFSHYLQDYPVSRSCYCYGLTGLIHSEDPVTSAYCFRNLRWTACHRRDPHTLTALSRRHGLWPSNPRFRLPIPS